MLNSGYSADRLDEFAPPVTLRGQNLFACGSQPIVAPSPLSGLLHPAAANPAALLEPVKQWVERCDVKAERAARPQFDKLTDVVPMSGAVLHERKNQQLGAAFLQFAI